MTVRSDAFKAAQAAAKNKDGQTDRLWAIQDEMEKQGFKYELTKGLPDSEDAYSPMKIDIYQSNSNPTKFLSVEAGVSPAKLNVQDADYGSVKPFQTSVDLTVKAVALDRSAASRAILDHGYYLHTAYTR